MTQVTDLGLDNVNFTNMGYANGSVAGTADRSSVLNCHFKGSLERNNVCAASRTGGIVGQTSGSADIYFYRCSVNWKLTDGPINDAWGHDGGGIFGGAIQGVSTHILDCLTINNVDTFNLNNGVKDLWFGGIAAYGGEERTQSPIRTQEIDNCVAYTYMTSNMYGSVDSASSIVAIIQFGGSYTVNISNTYTSGDIYPKNSAAFSCAPSISYSPCTSKASVNINNVNWFADKTCRTSGAQVDDLFAKKGITGTKWDGTGAKTQAAMYDKAVLELPDNIWMNKSVISEEYMTNTDVTSTDGYTIYNSPVRNPLIIRVSYYDFNVNNGVEKETLLFSDRGEDSDGWIKVDSGDPL
ncbi:hypothetical protein, partial [uncultured Clostridium sp.]|uniref:hypothetical protein n=1 Tax=uncultured Clostridium sp. TaxID=59620 RepID=UPI0026061C88